MVRHGSIKQHVKRAVNRLCNRSSGSYADVLTRSLYAAFNVGMEPNHPDAELIDRLGGPAKLARILGFSPKYGTQRVFNWKSRGIPEVLRLRRTDLFGPAPPPKTECVRDAAA